MKILAVLAVLFTVSACVGVRGYEGSEKVCLNQSLLGISLIEVLSPCAK